MNKEQRKFYGSVIATLGLLIVFNCLWQGLELIAYGEIQPRIVDDIIGIPIMYSFYLNIKYYINRNSN